MTKAAESLGKFPSENYERPTRRRYIAKMCHVSDPFVGKISLQIVRSENDDRPTKRRETVDR